MPSFLNPTFLISILIALSIHEAAHAFVAHRLGDPTAKALGRLTLNPIAHLDPIGTLLFLVAGFGWGKPVPVNPRYFKHPKRDSALTALAGPASNLLLAFLCYLGFRSLGGGTHTDLGLSVLNANGQTSAGLTVLLQILTSSIVLNLGLMAFNLLPIAPLDGSKILHLFIPYHLEDRYEEFMRWGPYILLVLLVAENFMRVSLLSAWMSAIVLRVLHLFGILTMPIF